MKKIEVNRTELKRTEFKSRISLREFAKTNLMYVVNNYKKLNIKERRVLRWIEEFG